MNPLSEQKVGPTSWSSPLALGMLAFVLVGALVLRLHYYVGFVGSDDFETWLRALAFSQGDFSYITETQNLIATIRYGLAYPTALFFAVFGVSQTTTTLFPLTMSLATITGVYILTVKLSRSVSAGLMAAAASALLGLDISYSTILLPDVPLTTMGVWSVLFCVFALEAQDRSPGRASLFYLLAGFAAGYGISLKIVAVGIIGALTLWVLWEAIHRRATKPMLLIFVGWAIPMGVELLVLWAQTGDPLVRYHVIKDSLARYKDMIVSANLAPERITLNYLLSKAYSWTIRLSQLYPTIALVMSLAVPAWLLSLKRTRRNPAMSLVMLFLLTFAAMRVWEFPNTFSFQPRRLIPGAEICIALLFVTMWHFLRPNGRPVLKARLKVLLSLGLLTCLALLLFLVEGLSLARKQYMMAAERECYQWIVDHKQQLKQHPLFADHRSLRAFIFYSNANPPWDLVKPFPFFTCQTPEGLSKPIPPIFRTKCSPNVKQTMESITQQGKSYWFVNYRILRWTTRRKVEWSLALSQAPQQEHWTMLHATRIPLVRKPVGAIYLYDPPTPKAGPATAPRPAAPDGAAR